MQKQPVPNTTVHNDVTDDVTDGQQDITMAVQININQLSHTADEY